MKKYIITSLFVLSVGAGLAEAAKQSLQTVGETTHGDVRTTVNTNATRSNSNFTELYNRKQTGVTDWTTNGAGYTYAEDDLVKYGDKIYIALGAHVQDVATPDISDDFAEWAGGGPGDNPSFNSVNASSGNLAAANAQVTKKWITGLSYTADVTSVIHGGQHYICTSTHTAGASTEPGIGASWQTVWTLSGGAGDDLGSADYTDVVALWTTCSGYLKSDGTCDTPSGTFTYPGSGIPNSTGSAWGTSYSLDTDLSSTSASDDTIPSAKATKALFDSLPSITWGTGLTDTSNTISVTYPVTAEAWSGSGWSGDTDGVTRNDVYDYAHIGDTDDDGLVNKVDLSSAGFVITDSSGILSSSYTITSAIVANSMSLPGTCTVGNMYYDTDGDTDGELYVCRATNTWKAVDDDGGAGGGISGSTGSTDNALLRADGTGGSTVQSSGITVDDSNNVTLPGSLAANGAITGLMPAVVLTSAEGVHDGSGNAATLTDSGESWPTNAYVGMRLYNTTDNSSCTVTANTGTTMICTLTGGTDNDWDANDNWSVSLGAYQSGTMVYLSTATTILHPSTAGFTACYYTTGANIIKVDPQSSSMAIYLNGATIGDGDELDSPNTAGSYICLHNQSTTIARTLGASGTWTDGGAN